jgi:hypothetical protein
MSGALKHAGAVRGTADIRTFMRPITNAMQFSPILSDSKAADVNDGNVVDVNHVNAIAEQICSNCKERSVGNGVKKCGFNDWCDVCDASLWNTNPDVICTGVTNGFATLPLKKEASLESLSSAAPQTVSQVDHFTVSGHAKKRKVRAGCSSESDDGIVPPASIKRKRKVVVSSEDDVAERFEGEAEEAEDDDDNDSGGEIESEESDGDAEEAEDGDDDEADDRVDVAHTTGRNCIAVSEACAALRNRRKFKVSQNTCPLCADMRVVLSHLLGLE